MRAVPKSRIDQTLTKIAAGTTKGSSKSSSAASEASRAAAGPGDPNCPLCHGVGYLRRDLPLGHPDFGRVTVCDCRRREVADTVRERLFAYSHLEELRDLTFESFKPHGRKGLGELQARTLENA